MSSSAIDPLQLQKRVPSAGTLLPNGALSPHPSFHMTAPEDSEPLAPTGIGAKRCVENGDAEPKSETASPQSGSISSAGLKVLALLAVQNCSKNLLMRYVMKDRPNFLTSAAVIGVEVLKLVFSTMYILGVEKRSVSTIITYMREDKKNSMLLAVPATAYSLQMSLEYVALANIDAAIFSVLVQLKLLATATFAVLVLRRKLKKVQLISLILLTAGVMLCNSKQLTGLGNKTTDNEDYTDADQEELKSHMRGIMATLGIALSSGFASVYTEKVIKGQRDRNVLRGDYSLAYTQVQLALVSLVIIGTYALIKDLDVILENGLFHNFNGPAFVSIFNSAIGGLIVAAVLKYADSVLKGYATAVSVIMTGVLSMVLFGTQLNAIYFLGIINVVCAVLLYSGKNLEQDMC
eukprot:CAMPEP_0113526054 /NCGR_PEP_ID=MMETSP0015_2-20120614/526_1 /TAXON_ID=2838 /ORGANISM="Odontella" /LENGTH=405 /DNA_ID=CAMNT_0000424333 /DNA_START=124 /DNA_END=1341 /DNA_ORIENTATION=+ /assembly_acc=CAM_ASM_000160